MRSLHCWLSSLSAVAAVVAQAPAPAAATGPLTDAEVTRLEADLDRAATASLLVCAHTAESNRAGSQAKYCYQLIIDLYDADNFSARQALGYHKDKGQWVPAPTGKQPAFADLGTVQLKQRADEAVASVRKRLATLHRTLGIAFLGRERAERGRFHLERALAFDAMDVEAHKALGHHERGGLFASDEQFEFVDRVKAIRDKVREEQARDVPVRILRAQDLPVELQRTGLEFSGARVAHFTVWLRGDQTQAAAAAQWAERAHALLAFLVGAKHAEAATSQAHGYRWLAMLRSKEEYDLFFERNADRLDKASLASARMFGGYSVEVTGGRAYVQYHAEELDNDAIIGHVAEFGVAAYVNEGLGEGFVHAMTWMLVGTTNARYSALSTTSASGYRAPDFHAGGWLAQLRGQIDDRTDIPLEQVVRERRTNFRTEVRIKSWWFMMWLMARFPEQWYGLLEELRPRQGEPSLPAAAFEKVLGRSVEDVEAEWRVWALGQSPLARAAAFDAPEPK
jgi:hypothetical protein